MTRYGRRIGFSCCFLIFSHALALAQPALELSVPQGEVLTEEQREYFETVYRDTWNYLGSFVEKLTGLPYDSSARQPVTSMSNIGFYLASTAIAYRTGLISEEEASGRIAACLDSLSKVEQWRGFPYPWILVRSLKPTFGREFSYGSHMAVLIGGLIVVKNTLPEFSQTIERRLAAMRFRDLYEPKNGWLKGGYNADKKDFAIRQPWGHWYYQYFASEIRLLSFYMIARGVVPKSHWDQLIRPTKRKMGLRFYASGYAEAGLAVQYIPGLFLDERYTPVGESQKNYAKYQIARAEKMDMPVWGWTSSEAPDGRYLTFGELRDEIVSPHASILAAIYFPTETFKNLKNLEQLGVRPASGIGNAGLGFLDSVDWKTGQISKHYLTPSQGMIFLSLANLLHNGIVWKSFEADPIIQKGLEILNMADPLEVQIEKREAA